MCTAVAGEDRNRRRRRPERGRAERHRTMSRPPTRWPGPTACSRSRGTSARFGAWRYDVLADRLEWSSQLARIHDEPDGFTPSIAEAFEYFPPEYRDKIAGIFQTCLDEGVPFNENPGDRQRQGAQAVGPHDRRGGKGRRRTDRRRAWIVPGHLGTDVGAQAGRRVRDAAGKSPGARSGWSGWQVSLTDRTVHWTDGVAAIHDLPPGTNPSFEGGIDYFAPEERDSARQGVRSLRQGWRGPSTTCAT